MRSRLESACIFQALFSRGHPNYICLGIRTLQWKGILYVGDSYNRNMEAQFTLNKGMEETPKPGNVVDSVVQNL